MLELTLQSLKPSEKRVLFYYACAGLNASTSLRDKFQKYFKWNPREFDIHAQHLVEKELLKRGFFSYGYGVPEEKRLGVMKFIAENDRELFDSYYKFFLKSGILSNMLTLATYLFTDKGSRAACPYIQPQWYEPLEKKPITEPWQIKLLGLLNDKTRLQLIEAQVLNMELADEPFTPQMLRILFDDIDSPDEDFKRKMQSYKRYVRYLQDGIFPQGTIPAEDDGYGWLLAAVRNANLGRYEDASSCFTAAFKVFNQTAETKNVFTDFYASICYVLTLMHLGNAASLKKLDVLLRKKGFNDDWRQGIAVQLAQAALSDKHQPIDFDLRRMVRATANDYSPIPNYNRMAAAMLQYYFNHATTGIFGPDYEPKLGIFRHELSAYNAMDPETKAKTEALYGTKPLLSSLRRKEAWEWTIEDLVKELNTEEVITGIAQQPESRVLYAVTPDSKVEIYQQNWLKSGRWGAPKPLSMAKLKSGDVPGITAEDLEVAKTIQHQEYSQYSYDKPSIYTIAPHLVGSDRVVTTSPQGFGDPVKIEKEEPFVELKKWGDRLKIYANFQAKDLNDHFRHGCVVKRNSAVSYSIIPLSEKKKNIMKRLLQLGSFPMEAQAQMQDFLAKLDPIIEVRSILLSDQEVPVIDGADLITAKIAPAAGGQYSVTFVATPAEGFNFSIPPGEGRAVLYDNLKGKYSRIKRDLKGEVRNYNDILDSLPSIKDDMDEEFSTKVSIGAVLEILSFARSASDQLAVAWPEGKEVSIKPIQAGAGWNMSVKADNGWFDIEGDVKIDEAHTLSMAQLFDLLSHSRGDKYIRLSDQDYLIMDRKLRRQLEKLEALTVKNRNKVQISQFNAPLINEKMLETEFNAKVDKELKQLQQRISKSEDYDPKVPTALTATLRPYQVEGFQWMARLATWGAGGCLADDMGLGKTVQTIAMLLLKADEGPALVVAPASVVANWAAELERFAPSLQCEILNQATDREQCISVAGPRQVVLSTYGLLNTEGDNLIKKQWATICLDEAHVIKNKETKMSQTAMQLQAKYRYILTGTPIQNHLGELWNLFRFINPGLLGSAETFRTKFVNSITVDGDKDRLRSLQKMITPFMLRRTKADVIEDLPDKTEIMLPVELQPDEMAMYEAIRQHAAQAIEDAEQVDVNTLAEITRLRRAACSMQLIDSTRKSGGSKVDAFLDLVEEFQGGTNRMLVFSQFTSFLSIVRDALDKAQIPYLYFDGSTTMKQREEMVRRFREGECPLFLISLKAGGLGLNLPEANYVVHLDPWWNPAIEQQATDRAYRIGQKRDVTVYHLVAKNTIEEKILRLHRTKRDLADSLLEGTDIAGKLTVKDMLELVSANA